MNDICALGDYNGREIYVCDKNGIRGTVNTNLPIRSLSVAENGVVAAVLDDSSVTRINVYNGNSNTDEAIVHAKVSMDKSGYPISVCMSPNGRIMMVSYFFMDSGSMKSSIAFYNFGEVGENQTDNYVSGYDYLNTVVPYEGLKTSIDNQRSSVSGVDKDEEAVSLVKYQNSYTLASKMIQTLTEIYDQLILNTGV